MEDVVSFIRNAWYPAMWDQDLGATAVSRTFLDEPVVLFRDARGAPAALADMCPHRFAPLSDGRLGEGTLRCPYHGLTFDSTGRCVHNPHGKGVIPAALKVRAYELQVQDTMIWIWMGDEAPSGPPPRFDFLDRPGWKAMRGYLHVTGNYQLVMDNLLDLSHAEFLHPFIMPEGVASHIQFRAEQHGDRVSAYHIMPDQQNTPLFRVLMPDVERIDGEANMHWEAPANMMLDTNATALDIADRSDIPQAHLLTPESRTTTHYFWGAARDRALDDEQLEQMLYFGLNHAFQNEDEPMIAKVQQRMGDRELFELSPVLLPMDAAAVRARRIIDRRIAEEAQARAGVPAEPAAPAFASG